MTTKIMTDDARLRAMTRQVEEGDVSCVPALAALWDRLGRTFEAPLACQLVYLTDRYPRDQSAPGIVQAWLQTGTFYASIVRYLRTGWRAGGRECKHVVVNAKGATPERALADVLAKWHHEHRNRAHCLACDDTGWKGGRTSAWRGPTSGYRGGARIRCHSCAPRKEAVRAVAP